MFSSDSSIKESGTNPIESIIAFSGVATGILKFRYSWSSKPKKYFVCMNFISEMK